MGKLKSFFSNIFTTQEELEIKEVARSRELNTNDSGSKHNRIKQFFVKFTGNIKSYVAGREEIVAPDYDFEDIYLASEADSYVKQALSKFKSLIYKAGYQLKSENDEAVSYIKKRLKIFSVTCQKPIDTLFQEIADDIVTYSNAFIVKARDEESVYPGLKIGSIFDTPPVSGYFRLNPRDVYIKTNKHGSVASYIYKTSGVEQKIKPQDMIHIYLDKPADKKFGTPMIVAALEDVKLLRQIEGNVMALIYRFTMPIYHWSVGLEKEGQGASDREIDELTQKVAGMDIDGCIITNERTKVNAIGADKTALDASGYLSYFEKRVFSALGVSESQMGRGGSKQDADSMESQMHDTIKHIQRTIGIFIENYMLMELLLEGGFDPIGNERDVVSFVFNEISLETKIKLENHEMAKFQGNLTTFDEMRHAIGMKSDNVDENRLFTSMISNKSAIEQIKAKADGEIKVAKATAKLSESADNNNTEVSSIKGNGKQKSANNGSNGTIKSINTPSNQHGTTSVKIKENLSDGIDITEKISQKRSQLHKKYKNIYEIYQNAKNTTVINKSDLDFMLSVCFNKISDDLLSILKNNYVSGYAFGTSEIGKNNEYRYPVLNNYIESVLSSAKQSLNNIKDDISKKYDESNEKILQKLFDTYEYRIDALISYYEPKSYWCGYALYAKEFGLEKLYVDFNSEEDKAKYNNIIYLNGYSLDEIPAFHPFCGCGLTTKRKESI